MYIQQCNGFEIESHKSCQYLQNIVQIATCVQKKQVTFYEETIRMPKGSNELLITFVRII